MNQSERKCRVRLCIGLALSLLACPAVGYAGSVSLTWDANPEQDLAGYNVYQRMLPSTDYGSPVFSGVPSNPSAPKMTITNLIEGESYGFIAIAFDTSGNQSSPSTETQITMSSSGGGGSTDGGNTNLWPNANTGDVGVWLMNGLTISADAIPGGAPTTWIIAGIGDVDGDGKADLVWRDTSTGAVGAWLMNGVNTLTTGMFASSESLDWNIAGAGDLDGNGTADVVWRHSK